MPSRHGGSCGATGNCVLGRMHLDCVSTQNTHHSAVAVQAIYLGVDDVAVTSANAPGTGQNHGKSANRTFLYHVSSC